MLALYAVIIIVVVIAAVVGLFSMSRIPSP